MSEKGKVVIATAIISGICGIIAGYLGSTIQNNTTNVYVKGEEAAVYTEAAEGIYEENLTLKEDIEKYKKQIYDLKQMKEQASGDESKLQELQQKSESLENSVNELKNQKAELESANTELESRNSELGYRITELEANNAELMSQNEKFAPELLGTKETLEESIIEDSSTKFEDNVLLCNLSYITGKRVFLESVKKDNLGEEQTNVIFGCDNTYMINGEYSTISGTLFIEETKKNYAKPRIKVYGDDILLYNINLNPGDLPLDFSVDISGVEKLYVKLYQNTVVAECRLDK